jgi:hypothetical protein
MNMTTIASLLSSGVILISNPSLSSKEEQSSEGDVLPMTPAIYRSLSDLLQVINLFHTLIGMNWVSTYRSGQQLIRWRKSFVGSTVDKAGIVSVTETWYTRDCLIEVKIINPVKNILHCPISPLGKNTSNTMEKFSRL